MSPSPDRWKRKQEEQTRPIRNGFAVRQSSPAPGTSAETGAPGAAVSGLLEKGVRTAYSVIDEYLSRGQEVARGLFNESNRGGTMSDCKGSYPSGYPPPGYGPGPGYYGIWGPMSMMAEQWMTALRTLNYILCGHPPASYWQGPCPPQWQPPASGQPQNPRAQRTDAAAASPAQVVTLHVRAASPVNSTASLQAGLCPQELVCDPLFPPPGVAAKPIAAPTMVFTVPGTVQMNVAVPAGQPAGIYSGAIRRQSDKIAVGSLTVEVLEPQPVAAAASAGGGQATETTAKKAPAKRASAKKAPAKKAARRK